MKSVISARSTLITDKPKQARGSSVYFYLLYISAVRKSLTYQLLHKPNPLLRDKFVVTGILPMFGAVSQVKLINILMLLS